MTDLDRDKEKEHCHQVGCTDLKKIMITLERNHFHFCLSLILITAPLSLMVLIPGPISGGVARTWFGFHYQEQNKDSQYYSFNVMHIDSELQDYQLLTQLHGSFEPYALWEIPDFGQDIEQKNTNIHSRSKTIKGKRRTTGCMIDNFQDSNSRFQKITTYHRGTYHHYHIKSSLPIIRI